MKLSKIDIDGYILANDPTVVYIQEDVYYGESDEEVVPLITAEDAEVGLRSERIAQLVGAIEVVYYEGMLAIRRMEGTKYTTAKMLYTKDGVLGEQMYEDTVALAVSLGILTPKATPTNDSAILLAIKYGDFMKAVMASLVTRTEGGEDVSTALLSWRQRNYLLQQELASEANLVELYTEFSIN